MLAGIGTVAYAAATRAEDAPPPGMPQPRPGAWLDAKEQFRARGDGTTDDTHALQAAINAGSGSARPISLPPGGYRITKPLIIPPNTMMRGSAPGLGFGCRIEPEACPAFIIGGKTPSFQCSIEDLMIWPKQAAPEFVVSIDNSYSVTFRNLRLHDVPARVGRGSLLLLGDQASGGHGPCANIIWENLIVRNDGDQPGIAILAARGCGTHRFFAPDLENYNTLLEWRGGGLDLIAPYTERAGRYAVNCNLDEGDQMSYLNTFGGIIGAAASGVACAIRASTRQLNSFGTTWGTEGVSAYAYSLPARPVNFFGVSPNEVSSGKSRFSGVPGWRRVVRFPDHALGGSRLMTLEIPPRGHLAEQIAVPGVVVGEAWARATLNADTRGAQLSAYVSATDIVTVNARNMQDVPLTLSGEFVVECGFVSAAP